MKLQVEPVLYASLIHCAAHKITTDNIFFFSEDFILFFYLELQIWHGPQWSPSCSGSRSPCCCWVSGSGWSSSHCSPPGRHRQVSSTQKIKWFVVYYVQFISFNMTINYKTFFGRVPNRFITKKITWGVGPHLHPKGPKRQPPDPNDLD